MVFLKYPWFSFQIPLVFHQFVVVKTAETFHFAQEAAPGCPVLLELTRRIAFEVAALVHVTPGDRVPFKVTFIKSQ